MSNLIPTVALVNGNPATTSLKIAECFGKDHRHVMRDIRELIEQCPPEFNASNFGLVEYTDTKGEKRPMYYVYFDGFMLLVMGYTGKKALEMKLAYMAAFNAMREKLEGQKRIGRKKAISAPIDPYQTYLEAVEDFRADTARRIDGLLNQGLALLDTRRLGPGVIIGFTPILIDWLQRIAGQHTPLIHPGEPMNRAIEYSPLYMIRAMERMQIRE